MRLIFKIFSILLVLYVLLALSVLSVKAACRYDTYGNCVGTCGAGSRGTCEGNRWEGCSCVYSDKPTSPPGGGGGTKPTNTPALPTKGAAPTETKAPIKTPYPSPLPSRPLSPYETKCGNGICTNGFYCCQNPDGSAACCPVGAPPPNGGGSNPLDLCRGSLGKRQPVPWTRQDRLDGQSKAQATAMQRQPGCE